MGNDGEQQNKGINSQDRKSDATRIINAIQQGDIRATNDLLPLVYEELRLLAAQKLSQEIPGQTLQATALVHEAYIRLLGSGCSNWDSKGHFFAAAAEAINARREILLSRRWESFLPFFILALLNTTIRQASGRIHKPIRNRHLQP